MMRLVHSPWSKHFSPVFQLNSFQFRSSKLSLYRCTSIPKFASSVASSKVPRSLASIRNVSSSVRNERSQPSQSLQQQSTNLPTPLPPSVPSRASRTPSVHSSMQSMQSVQSVQSASSAPSSAPSAGVSAGEYSSVAHYPLVRERFPPGGALAYGSMSPEAAWEFHRRGDTLRRCRSLWQKIWQLNTWEHRRDYFQVQLPLTLPERLPFAQQLTNTRVIHAMPPGLEKAEVPESVVQRVKLLACDLIQLEFGGVKYKKAFHSPFNSTSQSATTSSQSESDQLAIEAPSKATTIRFMSQLMDLIMQALRRSDPAKYSYMDSMQVSSTGGTATSTGTGAGTAAGGCGASVMETYMKRAGFEHVHEVDVQRLQGMSEYLKHVYKRLKEERFGHVHFQLVGELPWSCRARTPLHDVCLLCRERVWCDCDRHG